MALKHGYVQGVIVGFIMAFFGCGPAADGELFDSYDLIAMPSSYVIDRQGRIVARHLGFKSVQVLQYEAMLRDVLAKENGDVPH